MYFEKLFLFEQPISMKDPGSLSGHLRRFALWREIFRKRAVEPEQHFAPVRVGSAPRRVIGRQKVAKGPGSMRPRSLPRASAEPQPPSGKLARRMK